MTDTTEVEAAPETLATVDTTDRRRPGRLESVSPALIPILRRAEPEIEFDEVDQNSAIRGLFFGLLLSAPIWALIAYVGRWLLS